VCNINKIVEKLIKIAEEPLLDMTTIVLFDSKPSNLTYKATPREVKVEKGSEKLTEIEHINYLKRELEHGVKRYKGYGAPQRKDISVISMKYRIQAIRECIKLQKEEIKKL
jgi:hypothetical protein